MSTNYLTGLCNSDHCAHPCCWNYYRKLIKHQVTPRDRDEVRPRTTVEVPHQSIHNINADFIAKTKANISQLDLHRPIESKQNSLMEYLISRKKYSVPNVPTNTRGTFLQDATNLTRINSKISILDVHEVFDLEELQSDWRKAYKPKDYYVWRHGNKEMKGMKEELKKPRLIKTPVLQLAPVTDSQINSSLYHSTRVDSSLVGCGSDNFSQRAKVLRLKTLSKSITKLDPFKDNLSYKNNETKNVNENIRQKSLEATLNQAKMRIHLPSSKQFTRYDFFNSSQIYLLDDDFHHNIRDICTSSQSKQPPTSPIDIESVSSKIVIPYKASKNIQVHFKGVSIIQSAPSENNFQFKLEPHQKIIDPIKSATSTVHKDHESLDDDKGSFCDSMATNALSNRSTLNDDDILPGSNMLQMFQESYKLIQERSEHLLDKRKSFLDHPYTTEVQLHKINVSYSRSLKSAPGQNVFKVETPDPPPPSPDVTDRLRCISAGGNIIPDKTSV